MAKVHRMFFHYKEFPLSMRVLFTATLLTLGIGYLFGMLHIFNTHAGRDGEAGLSTRDLAIAYSGSDEATRLEAALLGPMSAMLPADEQGIIFGWSRTGATEREYQARVAPIIEKRCLSCHDGSNPHIYPLTNYAEVMKMAEQDSGVDIFTLIRVSHIHLFGLAFIFFITGLIFHHAYVRPVWFKAVVIAIPFAAIIFDIFSWYLTKNYPLLAWTVIASGGLMGASFTFQWVVSLYQIWFSKYRREGGDAALPTL